MTSKWQSAENVEKLRLECFCDMLHALGFRTYLTWQDTQYSLAIQTGVWPSRYIIQTLHREIIPSKPVVRIEWEPSKDCYTECAFTSLYQGALKCALDAMHISLDITDEVNYAVKNFSPILAHGLRTFPVQCIQETNGQRIFWVVSANPLNDKDHELTNLFAPNVNIRLADLEKYSHIYRHINLFLERYFNGIRTPFV